MKRPIVAFTTAFVLAGCGGGADADTDGAATFVEDRLTAIHGEAPASTTCFETPTAGELTCQLEMPDEGYPPPPDDGSAFLQTTGTVTITVLQADDGTFELGPNVPDSLFGER